MKTALSTTYTALKASISRKELFKRRNFEKVKFKLYKAKEYKNYMTTCCIHDIIPNYIKFRFTKFHRFKTYNIQCSLLKKELKIKNSQIFHLNFEINKQHSRLFHLFQNRDHLNILKYWRKFLENSLAAKINKTISIHQNKLKRLKILQVSQTRQLVYNLSSKTLNENTTKILELGPKFVFPENKFKDQNDKIEIENLVNYISKVNGIAVSSDLPELINEIRTVSEDYFYKQQTNNFKLDRNRRYIKPLQTKTTL